MHLSQISQLSYQPSSGAAALESFRLESLSARAKIFCACALTQEAEERSLYLVRSMYAAKKPSARIIISGCLPKIDPDRLKHVHDGLTFDSNDKRKFLPCFQEKFPAEAVTSNRMLSKAKIPPKGKYHTPLPASETTGMRILEMLLSPYRRLREKRINDVNRHTFLIKIATGCLGHCAFCAVRRARGRLRSKPVEDILAEFHSGLSNGYNEFALIGTDTGSYGAGTLGSIYPPCWETSRDKRETTGSD